MSGLIRAELRRLFKRRVTRLMLVLLVLGLGGIVTAISLTSEQLGPEQVAAAEARAQQDYERAVVDYQRSIAECEAAEARGENTEERWGPDCGRQWSPQREDFQADWFLPYEFNFRAEFGIYVGVFAGIVAMVAFIVAASYVGAEWHHGGMMNLLLWRPKRLSVLFTKLGVLLGSLLTISVVLGALWTVAFWLIGKYDGQTGQMTQGAWQSAALSGARGVGLVLAVAGVAFGLASIGRHTAMALGVAVGLGVVSEILLRMVLEAAGVTFAGRYVLSSYVAAWFEKSWKLTNWNSCNFSTGAGECTPDTLIITWQQSGVVFGAGTALVLALAIWFMRTRDIT
ncbi:ABC transporter permease subunit [Actinomycetes bacterium KLBMP 9797]